MAVEITDGTLKGKIISLLEYLNIIDSFPRIDKGETSSVAWPSGGTWIRIQFTKVFNTAPKVFITMRGNKTNWSECEVNITAITTSYATVVVWNTSDSPSGGTLEWLAIE